MKIDDIAKIAQVSRSAVSLALNGKNGVSEDTRKKILRIAEEHGYIPRPIVKADQYFQKNTKVLRFVACINEGIVTDQYETLPFFMELINNIDRQIGANGYSLMVSSVKIENLHEEITRLEKEQKSAGILLLGTNLTHDQIKLISTIQPKLVVLDTCFETLDVNFVVMNNVYGAYEAGKYLVELGHEKIGYVQSNTRMYNFDMRKKGFMQAIAENGLNIAADDYFSLSPTVISSQETFKDSIKHRIHQLPTALFCEADYMAISVMKSFTELGVKVPEDVSIIGFDNIFESQVVTPELTTINVKKDKIARLAVERLITVIENNETDKIKVFVDTQLITRNSCRTNMK
ncbi:LacI family transcriptional regulator [Bacillus canaveralius]|uniref:LacI family transcriptional regulator n=1 Tax=Bacillus canaveralius TaxID=1403243 RepID=A0A2N5GMR5_9BACI|nr:LacI family DNA-binding transcriptional regulator [Bacillus canaveralius]PLR83299.1 LacI family transcriptional regulator [Bacillus canaveralius]PLR96654.1 LacI family transcriptional regulator [Bacillus canaveralius]